MSHDEALVAKVAEALNEEGLAQGGELHGWRCSHPDRYGPCTCVAETARAVLDALDVPGRERRAKAAGAKEALARAIQAHRDLHPIYGSTAVCGGGIGGQAMTQHCAWTCENPAHHGAKAAWEAVEGSYFCAAEIDPEEGDDE